MEENLINGYTYNTRSLNISIGEAALIDLFHEKRQSDVWGWGWGSWL